jgi:hypothetical protein
VLVSSWCESDLATNFPLRRQLKGDSRELHRRNQAEK